MPGPYGGYQYACQVNSLASCSGRTLLSLPNTRNIANSTAADCAALAPPRCAVYRISLLAEFFT